MAVSPPETVFRVARRDRDPFAPPPWALAGEDGTFGNRFDDPSAASGVPPAERVRAVYCATSRVAAIGETVAGLRPSWHLLAQIADAVDDEEPAAASFAGLLDPTDNDRGVIPADWRLHRHLGRTRVDPSLQFVDITAAATLQHLRRAMAPVAAILGLTDVDLSAVTSPYRRLTQTCARYVYDQRDAEERPSFAGIRYPSRLDPAWECWAVFHDRMRHEPGITQSFFPDDLDLQAVAALFGLAIEVFDGHLLRPTT